MMRINEFDQVLEKLVMAPYIEGVSQEAPEEIIELYKNILADPTSEEFIFELIENQTWVGGDRYNKKSPYHHIFKSYAYHLDSDWISAQQAAIRAEAQFGNQKNIWCKAISLWLVGLLLCADGQLNPAQEQIKKALSLISTTIDDLTKKIVYKGPGQLRELAKTINKSYAKLEKQVSNEGSLWRTPVKKFREVIGLLYILENQSQLIAKWKSILDIHPLDSSTIDAQIESLSQILQNQEDTEIPEEFNYVFLAHSYNLSYYYAGGSEDEEAFRCITEAMNIFQDKGDDYNQAISHWYLALLYYNVHDEELCFSNLHEANELLQGLIELDQNLDDYKIIQYAQSILQTLISHLDVQKLLISPSEPMSSKSGKRQNDVVSSQSPQTKIKFKKSYNKPLGPEPTIYSKDIRQPKIKEPPKNPPNGSDLNTSHLSSIQIRIPVDIRALREDCASGQCPPDLFHQLQFYNERFSNKVQPSANSSHIQFDNESVSPIYIIPSFPIFGKVTAGPRGEPYLDKDVELASAIDESLQASFFNEMYQVLFINRGGATFEDGKAKDYGWLKVKGNSMNNATPQSICHNDYVLFYGIRDLEYCDHRIVVAFLPDLDDKLLMIKRLMKLSAPSINKKGFGYKIKFVLQSESLSDFDPETGLSYKNDIDIKNDFQLVGEVIAIAKPITSI